MDVAKSWSYVFASTWQDTTNKYCHLLFAGFKPFVCLICNTTFTRQHSLNYHMLIHNNQSRFTCKDCGRKFRHPSHFKVCTLFCNGQNFSLQQWLRSMSDPCSSLVNKSAYLVKYFEKLSGLVKRPYLFVKTATADYQCLVWQTTLQISFGCWKKSWSCFDNITHDVSAERKKSMSIA